MRSNMTIPSVTLLLQTLETIFWLILFFRQGPSPTVFWIAALIVNLLMFSKQIDYHTWARRKVFLSTE